MIVKWAFVGAIVGAIFGLFNGGGETIAIGAFCGAGVAIAIRKWIFRTFWS